MKLFDIVDSRNKGHWIVAPDEATAIKIAQSFKIIKKKAKAVYEVPPEPDMQTILNSGKMGQVGKQVEPYNIIDLFKSFEAFEAGLAPPTKPSSWIFLREYH